MSLAYRDACEGKRKWGDKTSEEIEALSQYKERPPSLTRRLRNAFFNPEPCPFCNYGDLRVTWGAIGICGGPVTTVTDYGCSSCDRGWEGVFIYECM
jgi:hypothetical protein